MQASIRLVLVKGNGTQKKEGGIMSHFRQPLALASIFLVVVLVGSIRADEVHIIRPTGIFPDDIANVQLVVDDLGVRGVSGKIILAACNEDLMFSLTIRCTAFGESCAKSMPSNQRLWSMRTARNSTVG